MKHFRTRKDTFTCPSSLLSARETRTGRRTRDSRVAYGAVRDGPLVSFRPFFVFETGRRDRGRWSGGRDSGVSDPLTAGDPSHETTGARAEGCGRETERCRVRFGLVRPTHSHRAQSSLYGITGQQERAHAQQTSAGNPTTRATDARAGVEHLGPAPDKPGLIAAALARPLARDGRACRL